MTNDNANDKQSALETIVKKVMPVAIDAIGVSLMTVGILASIWGTAVGLYWTGDKLGVIKKRLPSEIPIYEKCGDCNRRYQEFREAVMRAYEKGMLSRPLPDVEQGLNKYHADGHPFREF